MRNTAHDSDGVRVLEAVNRPELKHLTNCIVFAVTGARSEPDRKGGGDLDGDRFFAVFDPMLIPKRRDPPKPVDSDMRTAAIETFTTVRCNFLLGSLSNEWRSLVGATPELVDCPILKRLVPMIEAALNIGKSGSGLPALHSDLDLFKNEMKNTPRAPSGWTNRWTNPLDRLAILCLALWSPR
ncbi:RNA dependent RNA polymerase-domain-containing protein [Favolaschia claudopus]|uniref:RNA-dependent RNA polymerase n=1 Tax=Favolaschia claudopus TaxID=2862362 RepID=A0AAW0BVN5_9AGAR